MIPDINLLPKMDKGQSTSKNVYILISILVLILVAFFILQYFKLRGEISSLSEEEQTVIAERDQLQQELTNLQTNSGSLKQSVEFVDLISYPVSPIIDVTILYQPYPSYLREYSFDATTATVQMDFETLSDVSNYLSKLEASPFFQDVQVTSIEYFELNPTAGEEAEGEIESKKVNFNEIPRYKVEITLYIDHSVLAAGGEQS